MEIFPSARYSGITPLDLQDEINRLLERKRAVPGDLARPHLAIEIKLSGLYELRAREYGNGGFTPSGAADRIIAATHLINAGDYCSQLGRYTDARDYYIQAVVFLKKSQMFSDTDSTRLEIARCRSRARWSRVRSMIKGLAKMLS